MSRSKSANKLNVGRWYNVNKNTAHVYLSQPTSLPSLITHTSLCGTHRHQARVETITSAIQNFPKLSQTLQRLSSHAVHLLYMQHVVGSMLCMDSGPVWCCTPLTINQELYLILTLHSSCCSRPAHGGIRERCPRKQMLLMQSHTVPACHVGALCMPLKAYISSFSITEETLTCSKCDGPEK